ncbi:MAG: M23 family metallopeptidase [Chloroflexi bacterium]|nr:M23 family metallopeptidase [Chloroflexota bacterium]
MPDSWKKAAVNIGLATAVGLGGVACIPKDENPPIPITVTGIVYHDYNGDGAKEENEPVINGVELKFFSDVGKKQYVTKSNQDGSYSIALKKGKYTLDIGGTVVGYNNQHFTYLNISKEEFKYASLPVEVVNNMNLDVKLMQGWLTLPFDRNTKFLGDNPLGIMDYVDMDGREGFTMTWKSTKYEDDTYDNHNGIDFYMEENTPILAAAPGIVVKPSKPYKPEMKYTLLVSHENVYLYPPYKTAITEYCHLNEVKVKPGDKVKRGDVIGLSGGILRGKKLEGKHLHFGFLISISLDPPYNEPNTHYTDPYRNIETYSPATNQWTVDNNPQYP